MDFECIDVRRSGPVVRITMNLPERRNALSLAHMTELLEAFRQAGDSDATGVVLAANGPVFSAGHDFSDMAGADLDAMRRLLRRCTELMDAMQQIPQPVIARVHGLAMTGDPVDAATAADWGLINRAVPPDELDAAVDDLLARATRGSAQSKGIGKQAYYAQIDLDQPKAYAYAVEVMAMASQTPD